MDCCPAALNCRSLREDACDDKGIGHGLGMSQNTANEMAKEGKKYDEILQYFYEGTEMKEVAEILLNVE